MTKNFLRAALPLLLLALTPFKAQADEGMWTLYNLPKAVYEAMQGEGFRLPYSSLYADKGAIKGAVVNFSGYCSGVVVSPDGLVFTNHHCGFEAIRSLSTVEHDYLLHGFSAQQRQDELPCKDIFVSFMVEQRDITPDLERLGFANLSAEGRESLLDSLQNAYNKAAKAQDSTYHVDIDPFFEGNKFYATTYQDFTDIRLAFAPPKSMGKFGGETDNWMWPRQTCDFSVFRIYANPNTNGPAPYSTKNVPYRPKKHAQVSLQGYKPGDFAMTMGYPGSTSRYLSSFGIRERRDAINAPRAQVRGVKQQVMKKHMLKDEAVRIKYDGKYAVSANYWKNSIGMNKCIDSIGLIAQKQHYEARIQHYIDSTGRFKGQLDFGLMRRCYDRRMAAMQAFTNFRETFVGTSELVERARQLDHMEVFGPKNKPKKQYIQFKDNSDEWDSALDKEALAVLMSNYRTHVPAQYLPKFYAEIDSKFGGNCAQYVDYLYAKSALMKSGKKLFINKKSYLKDPGVQLGLDLLELSALLQDALSAVSDTIVEQERYLCAAKLRMEEDLPHYSDANFTMRMSYGQVGGFLLNGHPSGYYTDANSLVSKMNRAAEMPDYYAEPELKALLSGGNFGPYSDPSTGKMQLCFLTNNDITGGNSGSPVFNADGNLIGLAFDGNWDSLASDINFDPILARCIAVDIRYVLFMMDKWGHAEGLIKEINAQ